MKLFTFSYSGLWLGGTAIVLAEDEYAAREMVLAHPKTITRRQKTNMRDEEAHGLKLESVQPITVSGVIYNDNGDY